MATLQQINDLIDGRLLWGSIVEDMAINGDFARALTPVNVPGLNEMGINRSTGRVMLVHRDLSNLGEGKITTAQVSASSSAYKKNAAPVIADRCEVDVSDFVVVQNAQLGGQIATIAPWLSRWILARQIKFARAAIVGAAKRAAATARLSLDVSGESNAADRTFSFENLINATQKGGEQAGAFVNVFVPTSLWTEARNFVIQTQATSGEQNITRGTNGQVLYITAETLRLWNMGEDSASLNVTESGTQKVIIPICKGDAIKIAMKTTGYRMLEFWRDPKASAGVDQTYFRMFGAVGIPGFSYGASLGDNDQSHDIATLRDVASWQADTQDNKAEYSGLLALKVAAA